MDPSRSRASSAALVDTSPTCTLSLTSTQAERSLRQQTRSSQPRQLPADEPSDHESLRKNPNQNTSLELNIPRSPRVSISSKTNSRPSVEMLKAPDNGGDHKKDSTDGSSTVISSWKDRKSSKPEESQKDDMIKSLRSDLQALKNMVTCTICVRLLYEPYTIHCGHTFCYSCLCTWFLNNKSNKTCPDCRSQVIESPAPAYLVRQMIDIFISRTDLQTGESSQEHKKLRKEEAAIIEADKGNTNLKTGGLFKGCFSFNVRNLRTIRDNEDGVDRCPVCFWELEDSRCPNCSHSFGPDGQLLAGSSFGAFSDMEEDFYSSSEIDEDNFGAGADLEMSFEEMDDFDSDGSTLRWQDYDSTSDAIQREIARGAIRSPAHRRAAHSAAGSRARRYAHSIHSDMQVSEDGSMARVDEEDEEDEDEDGDENDSLEGFIVNDDSDDSQQQPHHNTSRRRRGPVQIRARSSPASTESQSQSSKRVSPAPDMDISDDDDFDEGGDISNRRRRRLAPTQSRMRSRRRYDSHGPLALSTTMEEDEEDEEEVKQALLGHQRGWEQLDHDNADSINGYDDDDNEASIINQASITSDRSRFGGSLTPTAERPNPSARPSSRSQRSRPLRGSFKGLRRLSSSSTISTVTHEDGEADDDNSDSGSVILDPDGDIEMSVSPPGSLQGRGSKSKSLETGSLARNRARENQGMTPLDAIDVDTDSTSDTSLPPLRRRPQWTRQESVYDPRIGRMLAEYQMDMHQNQTTPDLWENLARSRSSTPLAFVGIARPPTANRHRRHPPTSQSPFEASAQPSARPFSPPSVHARNSSEVPASGSQMGNLQASNIANKNLATSTGNKYGLSYQPFPTTSEQARPSETPNTDPPPGSNHQSQRGTGGISNSGFDRPKSRTAQISPNLSHSSRRGGSGREVTASPLQQPYPTGAWRSPSPRYNLPAQNNPYYAHVRPRPSTRTLREQSSTDTLRARTSHKNLRAQPLQSNSREPTTHPTLRSQGSRSILRRPSQQRLYSQASIQNLRSRSNTPASSIASTISSSRASSSTRLTEEETRHRASELVKKRKEAIARNSSGLGLTGRATSVEATVSQLQPRLNGNGSSSSPHAHRSSSVPNSVDNPLPFENQAPLVSPNSRLQRQSSRRNMGHTPAAFIPDGFYGSSNSPYQNTGYQARSGPGVSAHVYGLPPALSSPRSPMMAGGETRNF